MKNYQKPAMLALSLSANDALCGSCAGGKTIMNDPQLMGIFGGYVTDVNKDGTKDSSEYARLFASTEDQCSDIMPLAGYEQYCKYTGMDTQTVIICS